MEEFEINLDGFSVNRLIGNCSGTLYEIAFQPKEQYTDLNKFFAAAHIHLYLSLVESLSETAAMKVCLSFDIERGTLGKDHCTETPRSKCRRIYDDSCVDGVLDALINDVKRAYARRITSRAELTSMIAAKLHIVADTTNHPIAHFGTNSMCMQI